MHIANNTKRNEATANECWGESLPEWIVALAKACDRPKISQRYVASELGVSVTTINLLLKNKYAPRDHTLMQAKIEALFMQRTVFCPVLGEIDKSQCLQEQAKPFVSCDPVSVQLYRACRNGCQHFNEKE